MTQGVLVVDDDAAIRETIRWILDDAGYVVDEAADGQPALTLIRTSRQPLVVLLDLRMPGMDGRQVLETVAADTTLAHQHVFVLVTANDKTLPLAFVNMLTALGVRILGKPFEVDDLLTAVAEAAQRLLPLPPGQL